MEDTRSSASHNKNEFFNSPPFTICEDDFFLKFKTTPLFSKYEDIFIAFQESGDMQAALNAISSDVLSGATNEVGVKYIDKYVSHWNENLGPDSDFRNQIDIYNQSIIDAGDANKESVRNDGETP